MSIKKGKVFVGMSGGVDSSVAAYLLKKQGYKVVGVFIRGYNVDGCSDRDAEDARRVAEHLEIPFYVWDFEKEYKQKVVDYMIAGYKKGLTPNPDVMCNREIKFGIFFDRAIKLGANYVATGHYVRRFTFSKTGVTSFPANEARLHLGHSARRGRDQARISSDSSFQTQTLRWGLGEAKDKNKDQSYFLWTLTPRQIEKSLFPIGDYLKPEVRRIGKYAGVPTAEKKDSQGICFLGMISIKDFLKSYLPEKKGDVLNLAGSKIGEHSGAHFYTIGQRGGIGNLTHGKGQKNHVPFYVAKKDVRKNTLVVAEGKDNPALYEKSVYLTDINFSYLPSTTYHLQVFARVRYRQPLFRAVLSKEKNKWRLDFKQAQKFVAPGQSAVIYSAKSEVLGGGVIL